MFRLRNCVAIYLVHSEISKNCTTLVEHNTYPDFIVAWQSWHDKAVSVFKRVKKLIFLTRVSYGERRVTKSSKVSNDNLAMIFSAHPKTIEN